jgi:very-short-patch-repair endonuclease/predicted nucleic acid-binding Zn ribbon protein
MIKIYGREFSLENLKEIVGKSNSISECIRELGFTYDNSKLRKLTLEVLLSNNIDLSHFDNKIWHKNKIKYPKITKICPVCSKEFDTQQGHPREKETCSHKCSNIHFSDSRHSDSANKKRSNTMIEKSGIDPTLKRVRINGHTSIIYEFTCKVCLSKFETKKADQLCCSNKCSSILRNQDPGYHEKLSLAVQKRIANGTHKGWSSRSKLEPSYAEKYVIGLLNELNISYTRELKISKWFIDFADSDRKLALEIDGKQHNYPDRILSDNQKDSYLIKNGWQVLRLKWKKITKEFRNELILNITSFFNINSKTAS